MTLAYKLTTQDMTTHKGFRWVVGKWYTTSGDGKLCGPGWLHGYTHPLLAILLNPTHANIRNPRLWEIETDGKRLDDRGLKFGVTRMQLVREMPLPVVTTEQRVAFAILCALEVPHTPAFTQWAKDWLNGSDRTPKTAWTAWAAAWAAESAAWAAWAAAARTAAWAAWAAAARTAAWAAESAAESAAETAAETARVLDAADIDLIALAEKAMTYGAVRL